MLRRLAADLGLWYLGPGLFLALYVCGFGRPISAVAPHLALVAIPLLAVQALRLLLARIASRRIYLAGTAIMACGLLAILLLYYVLVVIGLRSWGGVVAWHVIPTFFAQATVLGDALGMSAKLLFAMLLLGFMLLLASCHAYLRHFDWALAAAARMSMPMIWTILAATCVASAIELGQLKLGVWVHDAEPISVTLFPPTEGLDLEGIRINPLAAASANRRENAAREAYVASRGKKNLILILVDALRPDHMEQYGYPRHTTPNLLRIAGQHATRVVTEVHSTCGDTACAMFSLFSSEYPDGYSFHPFFLHEVLRRSGYRLQMMLSGDHTFFYSLIPFYGAADIFYDGSHAPGYYLNDDQLVVDKVASLPPWDGAPVMLQFHLMSAHILRKRQDDEGVFEPAARYAFRDSRDIGAGGVPLQSAVNFYDNGVVRMDSVINELLRKLEEKGYLHDTLVVITADHGESLGEHGLFHHANSVREELLRIPLLLISYGYAAPPLSPTRIFPSQVDIAPTIVSELGLQRPESWAGKPLQEPDRGGFSFFAEHSDMGLIDRRDPQNVWKYWRASANGEEHVFNLSADPHENHDLHAETPTPRLLQWRAQLAPEFQATLPIP